MSIVKRREGGGEGCVLIPMFNSRYKREIERERGVRMKVVGVGEGEGWVRGGFVSMNALPPPPPTPPNTPRLGVTS